MLRSGVGLQSYKTERNEEIWIENGVQYRPFPFLEKKDNPFYTSEFEAYVPFNKTLFFEGNDKKSLAEIKEKKIILWWQHKIFQAPINELNPLRACPDFPCVLTSDRKYTENSSAILVNAQFVNNESPPKRRPDQVFIHYQIEAPFKYWWYIQDNKPLFDINTAWNEAFNWTMSYRINADITTYHGLVRKHKNKKEENYQKILLKKKGLVAWMVSNCDINSRRQDYVKELQKYIPVDIYEKLYRYLNSDMIVIARGYNTYSRLVPSEIFLNTANFKSPKELADKIIYLDSHDQEYIQMLTEKDKYIAIFEDYPVTVMSQIHLEYRYEAVPMCDLCRRLWNLDKYSKSIKNMSEWFTKAEYQCQKADDLIKQHL
ncbi:hypothetical protein Btru_045682 [Bulinus truncatus]|nr:hypothetical protein Btru_045682 [Bulinus truncatus]